MSRQGAADLEDMLGSEVSAGCTGDLWGSLEPHAAWEKIPGSGVSGGCPGGVLSGGCLVGLEVGSAELRV